MDRLLEKCKPLIETLKEYGNRIHEIWENGSLKNQYATILHRAVREGNVYIVGFLLDSLKAGGNNTSTLKGMLFAKNGSNLTTWQHAAQKGHVGILKKLWELAKIYNFENTLLDIDTNIDTGLHLAVWKGRVGAALFLLEIGANVLARLHDGSTVLHEAVLNNNIELITLILEATQKQGLTGSVNAQHKEGKV
jgi:ankyrin repeat protein